MANFSPVFMNGVKTNQMGAKEEDACYLPSRRLSLAKPRICDQLKCNWISGKRFNDTWETSWDHFSGGTVDSLFPQVARCGISVKIKLGESGFLPASRKFVLEKALSVDDVASMKKTCRRIFEVLFNDYGADSLVGYPGVRLPRTHTERTDRFRGRPTLIQEVLERRWLDLPLFLRATGDVFKYSAVIYGWGVDTL